MTKLKLINAITEKTKMTKKEANDFFNCFNQIIIDALQKNDKVPVPGLGIIQLRDRQEKNCKLPKKKEILHVPAHVVPVLKMSKKMKTTFRFFAKNNKQK
ncbi:HU family DNA-binding protein [Candidatus Phytoplasma sacchari]|uniref:HU family DNA-binding protein n=1 Tax=Candidatus Phytoplasma sacchari TaxID=2609813 RepID=A0ABY7M3G8_9MOLU|nr:HU family DNA-binding protein [Candidatus Phytoplasma sacchari]